MVRTSKKVVDRLLSFSVVESKPLMRFFTWLNIRVYRLSGGRLMNTVDGCPICLATITGRKSGQRKTLALMYVPHGDDVLLVASLGGSPKNPLWYLNLLANPQVDIEIRGRRRQLLAREASPEEHARLWPVAVAHYPSYAEYQKRTERRIPILICSAAR